MTEHWTREERETLETLDRLASSARAEIAEADAEAVYDEELAHQHRTLFALLAFENEPEAPSAACRERILNRITESVGDVRTPAQTRSVEDLTLAVAAGPQAMDKTLVHSGLAPDNAELGTPTQVEEPEIDIHPALLARQQPARTAWWSLSLAALLGIAVVGLAFYYGQVTEERATIARLNADLQQIQARQAELESRSEELLIARRRLDMITTVARQAYPMRPVAASAGGPEAEGIVFVCGRHQQWYLSLHGLDPAPTGQQYVLWYVTEGGPVNAGVVTVVDPGDSAELDALSMPRGTHAFMVTLEQHGNRFAQPQGQTVVMGDQPVYL